MAPKPSMKRPAAVSAAAVRKTPAAKVLRKEAPAKVPRTASDPVGSKCQLIEAALQEASGVPEDMLSLLVSSVDVLRVLKDERHKFQAAFVGMIEEALRDLETRRKEASEQAKAASAIAGASKVSAEAAQGEADQALAELQEAAVARTEKERDLKAKLGQAREALVAAQTAQVAGDAELDAAGGKKAALETLRSETFAPLRDWTLANEKEAKGKVSELVVFGRENGLDTSLLGILPKAFKDPSIRSSFDCLGIQQLEAELNTCAAKLEATIEEGEPAKAAREKAVQEAQAACGEAGEHHDAAASASAEADAAAKGAKKAAAAAAKALKDAAAGLVLADAAAAAADAELTRFRQEAMAAFLELRDLAPAPAAEEEVTTEAAPAEASPQAEAVALAEAAPMEAEADPGIAVATAS